LHEDAVFSTHVHEIGHTAGLHHEQSRPDRNRFVQIRLDEMNEVRKDGFQQMEPLDQLQIGFTMPELTATLNGAAVAIESARTVAGEPGVAEAVLRLTADVTPGIRSLVTRAGAVEASPVNVTVPS